LIAAAFVLETVLHAEAVLLARRRVILITQHLTVLVTTSKANVSMFWLKTVESKTLLFTLRITSEVEPTSAGLKL
jgi:hypothetical protein